MRILLATAGSRGDVEPFAELARRAAAAGHQVRLVAPDESGVDLAGIDWMSLGVNYTRMIEQQGVSVTAALRSYRSVVRPTMHGVIVGSARAALEYRPDVLVAHPKVLSAPIVASALGIPFVLAEIVPAVTPTAAFPAAGTTTHNLGFLNRWTYAAAKSGAAMFRSDLEEVASLTGTSRKRASPPAATLIPVSPAVLDRPNDWPDNVHLTGPWRSRNNEEVAPEVRAFVTAGNFIYAGFGSMAAGDPTARAREVVRAIRHHGFRALITTGLGGLQVPPDLMAGDLLVVQSVNHDAVLPHAEAAIHHGGIGTVHAATLSGAVSVVIPFIADQPFWGARLYERRLAPQPIPQGQLTSERLSAALGEAANYREAVEAAAGAMRTEDGTGAAIKVLEALA